jgi:hypothetical protein
MFGEEVTAAKMREAANKLPLGSSVIAINCVPGASLTRRMIGGLVVLTIGSLDMLPMAMRRAAA